MNCRTLSLEDLVAWLDDELPPADRERVAAHVGTCAACAREADLLRRSGDLVRGLPGHEPAPGFGDRVASAVGAQAGEGGQAASERATGSPASPRRTARLVPLPRWIAAAAAVIVAGVAGTWLATRGASPGGLSSREEEEIARDLLVLAHLETLTGADADDLATIADDLDVIETVADAEPGNGG